MGGPAVASDRPVSPYLEAAWSTLAHHALAHLQVLAQAQVAVQREDQAACPSAAPLHSVASESCSHWGQGLPSAASLKGCGVPAWSILGLTEVLEAFQVHARLAFRVQMDLVVDNCQSPILVSSASVGHIADQGAQKRVEKA